MSVRQQGIVACRLPLLVNSIKGHDAIDEIAIGQGPEGVSLVLIEALDSGRYETRIYLYKGTIVEEYSLDQAPYDPSRATPLVESGHL